MPKSIAICGIRGIPASYGGFETFAEEIAPLLSKSGYAVRVYGRKNIVEDVGSTYKGVNIVLLPTIQHKYAETPVHSLLCFLHLLFKPVDAVLVCNGANSPFVWILKLKGIPIIINVDGIERKRAKWNKLGKLWYLLGEQCSVLFADKLVSDAKVIAKYYLETYQKDSEVIPYGYNNSLDEHVLEKIKDSALLAPSKSIFNESLFAELGLKLNSYLLFVSRLEPENNAHIVIKAYKELFFELKSEGKEMPYPLVIVGDAPYSKAYIKHLKELASSDPELESQIIFAGYRFGEAYKELQYGARLYIQATEVGGTHPALVEAMGFGNCVIANSSEENVEVLGDAGELYKFNSVKDLARVFKKLTFSPQLISLYRNKAFQRAQATYNWREISSKYSKLVDLLTGVENIPNSSSKSSSKVLKRKNI